MSSCSPFGLPSYPLFESSDHIHAIDAIETLRERRIAGKVGKGFVDCERCGNPIPVGAFTCRFCGCSQSLENFPKTVERVVIANLENGFRTSGCSAGVSLSEP